MTSLKLLLKFKMEHDYVNEMNANVTSLRSR